MINILITAVVGVAMFVGGLFTQTPSHLDRDWANPPFNLGAVSWPSSLDVFENPGASSQVSTIVTHSTHHANANDAIEALEAKVGTGASTAVVNTIFGGTGTGASAFLTHATATGIQVTRATTTNLLAIGSTTLQDFTASNSTMASSTITGAFLAGNSTSTNNFVSRLASSTEIRSNVGNIGNLTVTTCTGCSSGAGFTMYTASSTGGVPKFKTLNLIAGDVAVFEMQSSRANAASPSLHFRVSSPWSMASTTCTDYGNAADYASHISCVYGPATTTVTVTLGFTPATGAQTYYSAFVANIGLSNSF